MTYGPKLVLTMVHLINVCPVSRQASVTSSMQIRIVYLPPPWATDKVCVVAVALYEHIHAHTHMHPHTHIHTENYTCKTPTLMHAQTYTSTHMHARECKCLFISIAPYLYNGILWHHIYTMVFYGAVQQNKWYSKNVKTIKTNVIIQTIIKSKAI